ncbi:tRNA-guanine transglycosylase, partial [Staphylococcus epidermidis]|uniref:tRNA-guanine transglycosylase n=1 Tax=Staphylococcus epidermidis TaxID=1282 RepID=UPI0037DA3ABF
MQPPQYKHLTQQTPKHLLTLHFPPYPIPPLSVPHPKPLIYHIVQHTQQFIPKHKPTYLIPLPSPHPFIQSTITPIHIFHSLLPTTIPTNATSITSNPRLVLKNPKYPDDLRP